MGWGKQGSLEESSSKIIFFEIVFLEFTLKSNNNNGLKAGIKGNIAFLQG
jgi:hypothetical protein